MADAASLLSQIKSITNPIEKLSNLNEFLILLKASPPLFKTHTNTILSLCENDTEQIRLFLIEFIVAKNLALSDLITLNEMDVLLRRLSRDTSHVVVIAVIRATSRLFRTLQLRLLRVGTAASSDAASVSMQLQQLRQSICERGLVHDNDAVRVATTKFVEVAALCYSLPDLRAPTSAGDSFHLLLVPRNHPILSADDLRDEGVELARRLQQFARTSTRVASTAAAIVSLASLVRQRAASFAEPLVRCLLELVTEPPTQLTTSYITSMRHLIRVQMILLLKKKTLSIENVAHDMLDCLANELAVPSSLIRQLSSFYGVRAKRAVDVDSAVGAPPKRLKPSHDVQAQLNNLPPLDALAPDVLADLVISFMQNLPSADSAAAESDAPLELDDDELYEGRAGADVASAQQLRQQQLLQQQLQLSQLDLPESLDAALKVDSFRRIVDCETSVARSGHAPLRVQLIVRLVANEPNIDSELVNILLQHVLDDVEQRVDLFLHLVLNEFARATDSLHRYDQLVHIFCNALFEKLSGATLDEALVGELFLSLPRVHDDILAKWFDVLEQDDAQRQSLAFNILQRVCVHRPASAAFVLERLFALTVYDGDDERRVALRATATKLLVLQLYTHRHLRAPIEQFAQQHLTSTLFFALSTQSPLLLASLIEPYNAFSEDEKKFVHAQLAPLVRQIGQNDADLHRVLRRAATDAPLLALQLLHSLTEQDRPDARLLSLVESIHRDVGDARLLVPLLGGMTRSQVRKHLASLLSLSKSFINNIVHRLAHRDAPYYSPFTSIELLVLLHEVSVDDEASSSDLLNGLIAALTATFQQRDTVTQETVAVALQRLVAVRGRQPPLLLLRTVLLALSHYPTLARFVCHEVLPPLIQSKIWTDERRWQGFIRVCLKTLPQSCNVLMQLPSHEFQRLLAQHTEFAPPLIKYANERRLRLDSKRSNALTDAMRQRKNEKRRD